MKFIFPVRNAISLVSTSMPLFLAADRLKRFQYLYDFLVVLYLIW